MAKKESKPKPAPKKKSKYDTTIKIKGSPDEALKALLKPKEKK